MEINWKLILKIDKNCELSPKNRPTGFQISLDNLPRRNIVLIYIISPYIPNPTQNTHKYLNKHQSIIPTPILIIRV